jgi:3-hydroxyisobutyrate dehydrogenase
MSRAPVPRIGLLGLGRMGLPIAGHLVAAGFSVTAFDPVPAQQDLAAARGIPLAPSMRAVAAAADVLVTVLPGPPELREALLGADGPDGADGGGILGALRAGTVWLDLTSNDPRVASEIAVAAAARGVASAGAPMGGGVSNAEARTLRFYVGADTSTLERVAPILRTLAVSNGIDHVGDGVADGYTAKLLANLLWFGQATAVTEALLLGTALGLTPDTLRATLMASAGGSVFLAEHLPHLLDGNYLEEFGVDRVVEELDALSALARAHNIPFETSDTVVRLHREALAAYGPVGGELLAAKLLEERAGITLRHDRPGG